MKTIAIIITALFATTGLSAQENNPKQLAGETQKNEKKEQRDALLSSQFNETTALVNSMQFTLEADYLSNQYGYRRFVSPTLNFIIVDSATSVIQTGRNVGIGYNGVGGITAKGNISSWKVQTNIKKKNTTVEMNVLTNTGFLNVVMNISATGKTTATLTGNWPGRLVYDGHLVPLDKSLTFQGSSL